MIEPAAVGAFLIAAAVAQGPVALPEAPRADLATVDTVLTAAVVADALPRREVTELRPRIGVEITGTPSRRVTFKVEARAEALVADRGRAVRSARGEVREAWVEARWAALDLRGGYGRLAWGRLDEIAPTDVINPIDASRFLFEGRSEARLPVSFVRGRVSASENLRIEGVLVPIFRRGLFDRLDESTSPFNLTTDAIASLPVVLGPVRREPRATLRNMSGGGRVDFTAGRIDIGLAAFRGFDGLGPATIDVPLDSLALHIPTILLHHPRFTMIGGDFETVTGAWAWRGEVAGFVDRRLAARSGFGLIDAQAVDAGIGFDRRVGESRVFGSVILHREWSSADAEIARTDVSIVGSIERSYDRERYFGRAFVVANPADRAAFVRGLLVWKPRDRLSVEGLGGTFLGTSDDAIGRFRTRDFILMTVRTWMG